MLSPLVFVALAAIPPWRADGPVLDVGILCTKGDLSSYALQSAQKAFAPGTIAVKVTPRAASGVERASGDLPPAEKQAFSAAMQVSIYTLRWDRADSAGLPRAYAAIGTLARACTAVVVDFQRSTAVSAATWKNEKESPRPAPIGVGYHFGIIDEAAGAERRVFTRGLARFGLAEVALSGVHPSQLRPAQSMITVVVQRMAEGLVPNAGGEMVVRIDDITDAAARSRQQSTLQANAKKELTVKLDDKGELSFPRITCSEPNACLEAAFDQLFGSKDEARTVQTTDDVQAATARARVALAPYKARIATGLPNREYLLVKGPFAAKGTQELMWIEVKQWKDGVLTGPLRTQPTVAVELVPGQTVTVKEAEVLDYIHRFEDGTFLGNETGRARYPESFEPAGNGRFREKR